MLANSYLHVIFQARNLFIYEIFAWLLDKECLCCLASETSRDLGSDVIQSGIACNVNGLGSHVDLVLETRLEVSDSHLPHDCQRWVLDALQLSLQLVETAVLHPISTWGCICHESLVAGRVHTVLFIRHVIQLDLFLQLLQLRVEVCHFVEKEFAVLISVVVKDRVEEDIYTAKLMMLVFERHEVIFRLFSEGWR